MAPDRKGMEMAEAQKAEAADAASAKASSKAKADRLAAAQAKAPNLDAEFVAKHGLEDDYLDRIAAGLEPPPPSVGVGQELHRGDGGWNVTAAGEKPVNFAEGTIGSLR